jgi:flavorubredoxin
MTMPAMAMEQDWQRPVEIAPGVFWVGFYDVPEGFHCNPYLIMDGDEAVLIDGGSRPDFPVVMMKILQTGCLPTQIRALIYQHYDPDLCGSIPNLEEMIARPDLQIIAAWPNHMFITHYAARSRLCSFKEIDHRFRFSSGRELQFVETPYAHSQGSSVTFDSATKTLFSSDLFGNVSHSWELFLELTPECRTCRDFLNCPQGRGCPLSDLQKFHRHLMPAKACLEYALQQIEPLPFAMIAPQHGSILRTKEDGRFVLELLKNLDLVGIDGIRAGFSQALGGAAK